MTEYRAYVIINTDLISLGRGKGHAHTFHAGNKLTWDHVVIPLMNNQRPNEHLLKWHNEGSGFGTCIALGDNDTSENTLIEIVEYFKSIDIIADTVIDPEYPYFVDSEIVKLIDKNIHTTEPTKYGNNYLCTRNQLTCAFVFGEVETLQRELKKYKLVPND